MHSEMPDLTGKRFGRLIVLRKTTRRNDHRMHWLCRCDCGKENEISGRSLLRGTSRSCGCLKIEISHTSRPKHGKSETKEGKLFYGARHRAKNSQVPFNLDIHDIVIPKACPLLGIPIFPSNSVRLSHPNSPSLDRKDPRHGYVKGNVWVISYRANMIKSNASLDELKLLVSNLEASCNR